MTERPILFSAPMIRAILAGEKTQTRRVVKPEGADHLFQFRGKSELKGADEPTGEWAWCASSHTVTKHIRCPYGQPGDRLWVRETWAAVHYEEDDCWGSTGIPHKDDAALWDLEYRATHPLANEDKSDRGWSWKPAIHMPRWASRIMLEITGVRVERLQMIGEIDAMAEGAEPVLVPPDGGSAPHVEGFRALWLSINGPGSWEADPWVWVVEFKRYAEGGDKP